MESNKYVPSPIDTSDIRLPQEIAEIAERLAKNTHETWALQRMAEGWKYGKQRDDVNKLHPCLIPYEELPENEKEYDRNTASEALKLVMAFGFEIRKKE